MFSCTIFHCFVFWSRFTGFVFGPWRLESKHTISGPRVIFSGDNSHLPNSGAGRGQANSCVSLYPHPARPTPNNYIDMYTSLTPPPYKIFGEGACVLECVCVRVCVCVIPFCLEMMSVIS